VPWSLALKEMVNWAALTKVAVCPAPLYVTVELLRKFVPLMVRVWAAAPAVAEEGESAVILGMGLGEGGGELLDPPPPHPDKVRMTARRNTSLIRKFN